MTTEKTKNDVLGRVKRALRIWEARASNARRILVYGSSSAGIYVGLPEDAASLNLDDLHELVRQIEGEPEAPVLDGTFKCPICGKDEPHTHKSRDYNEYRARCAEQGIPPIV